MVESSQHCKSREKKDYFNQVRAILQSKILSVVDEEQESAGLYTGECMGGFSHGEGIVKFYSGNEVKTFCYRDSRLGKFDFEFNIFWKWYKKCSKKA